MTAGSDPAFGTGTAQGVREPDPLGKAEEIKERRKRGPYKKKSGAQRRKEARASEGDGRESETSERPPYVATEAGIAMCAMLASVIWNMGVRPFTGRRELSKEELTKLGSAMDPVCYKYLPVLNDWAEEVALGVAGWEVWQATTPPPEKADDVTEAEVVP